MTVSAVELKAGLNAVRAVADAIRELKRVPAGHIYSVCVGTVSLNGFESIIGILVNADLVRRDGDVLVWIGE